LEKLMEQMNERGILSSGIHIANVFDVYKGTMRRRVASLVDAYESAGTETGILPTPAVVGEAKKSVLEESGKERARIDVVMRDYCKRFNGGKALLEKLMGDSRQLEASVLGENTNRLEIWLEVGQRRAESLAKKVWYRDARFIIPAAIAVLSLVLNIVQFLAG